ncbi:alpha/beta hydrolase family protein [Actinomadura rudentiformis]|uniref:Alpha/beta hydrolase n=1 Tax=Actinomadura rudentiformis TaxID=359158 RepID=A0A6H9YTF6_9ACTN|nr:alpha/beta hydrolase [Actinomadura rudentiformis]KAB2350161.1 alpha/beta hydrolase [Actinomadura rudentiformis]
MFANQAAMQEQVIEEIGNLRLRVDQRELPFFGDVRLGAELPECNEAVVIVHGALRNAHDYYRIIKKAAAGRPRPPQVIAPQFLTGIDVHGLAERDTLLSWEPEGWKSGLGEISSFEVMDVILRKLLELPGIQRVTIAGNSAGGQFVNRYAAVGREPGRKAGQVRFVIANPSTYLYFDRLRPLGDGFAEMDTSVDEWRYGFSGERPKYVAETADRYLDQYLSRDVVYLLGEKDDDPEAALLEVHPAATAQGTARLDRGLNYHRYLEFKAGRREYKHRLVRVPGVGHDAEDVFCSPKGRACLFGD